MIARAGGQGAHSGGVAAGDALAYARGMANGDEARAELRRAMALHAQDRIDEALAAARRAVALDPSSADALSYLGSTLVTRKRDYRAGLRALEQARDLAPGDPFIRYTLAWCYEYVAHEWPRGRRTPEGLPTIDELYALAVAEFRACLAAGPDPGLRDDVLKLLDRVDDRIDEHE